MSSAAASSAMVTVAESEFTGVPGAVAQQVAPPPEPWKKKDETKETNSKETRSQVPAKEIENEAETKEIQPPEEGERGQRGEEGQKGN